MATEVDSSPGPSREQSSLTSELTPKEKFSPKFARDETPICLCWSVEDVADWIEFLGFWQYKPCFTTNGINGRKLITIDMSSLPRIGITDFEHMKFISSKIRELLNIEHPFWNRSISLLYRENMALFLERKSRTGINADHLTYAEHLRQLQDSMPKGMPTPKDKYDDKEF